MCCRGYKCRLCGSKKFAGRKWVTGNSIHTKKMTGNISG